MPIPCSPSVDDSQDCAEVESPIQQAICETAPSEAQTATSGSHAAPTVTRLDHWLSLRWFIDKVEKVNLLAIAEQYLGIPGKEAGKNREQEEKELVVLVMEHLKAELARFDWAAQMMKGAPHVYTGNSWALLQDQDMSTFLGEFAEAMGIPRVMALSHSFRKNLLKQFKSRLRAEPMGCNPDQILVNFANGTLQIDDGEEHMRPSRKEDLLTYTLPFSYDPEAECPKFEQFLARVLPDESSCAVLSEFFGWAFIRGLKLEKALLLYGQGSNGKSVLFDVIRAMLGDQNVTTFGLSMLSKLENRFQLGSSLLNYASEFKGRCDTDIFKKMVSGEPLEARRLYKDPHIMTDYARLAFNVNELPKDAEHTDGYFRRFLIVPFNQRITESERNPDLAREIIAEELPGVFNWVMAGMRRLRETRKFTECGAAKEALQSYIAESDTVVSFITDQCLVPSEDKKVPKDALFQSYRKYCSHNGFTALRKNEFGRRLSQSHGIRERKSGSERSWLLEVRMPLNE